MKITERVEALLTDRIREMGYSLYDVEYAKEAGNMVLTLYIDKEEGVDLDDCEKVSRAVDPVLDEADPIPDAYYLSVSSVGLDHPIKKDRDFARNLGGIVELKLFKPFMGKKEFRGELVSYDEESFSLKTEEKEETLRFLRKDAAKLQPYIDFSNLLKEK